MYLEKPGIRLQTCQNTFTLQASRNSRLLSLKLMGLWSAHLEVIRNGENLENPMQLGVGIQTLQMGKFEMSSIGTTCFHLFLLFGFTFFCIELLRIFESPSSIRIRINTWKMRIPGRPQELKPDIWRNICPAKPN